MTYSVENNRCLCPSELTRQVQLRLRHHQTLIGRVVHPGLAGPTLTANLPHST